MKATSVFKTLPTQELWELAKPSFRNFDTSGPYSRSYILRSVSRDRNKKQLVLEKATSQKLISAREMLLNLRDGGIAVSTIADFMRVERKTIYAWVSGSIINQKNEQRIEKVYGLLSAGQCASYRNFSRYLNTDVAGNNVASILKSEQIDMTAAEAVLKTAWHLAKKTEEQLKNNNRVAGSRNPVHDEMSETF